MKVRLKRAAGLLLTMGLLIATPVVFASTTASDQRVDEIILKQEKIQADAKGGKLGWDNIPKDKRDELVAKQERLFALLQGKSTINELDAPAKTEVIDTLGWIDELALKAADERQVCRKERKTGSNFMQTVCMSAGSMRVQQEKAKEAMRRGQSNTHMQQRTPGQL